MKLLNILAYTRIPGNAFSFWLRRKLRWSRGVPVLRQECKEHLFDDLQTGRNKAEELASTLNDRYQLEPLKQLSPRTVYRKNLYLLEMLELATDGIVMPFNSGKTIKAVDVGSQDWHYVFALERWLRQHGGGNISEYQLTGVELDGYEFCYDFYSNTDYAHAYIKQTDNANVSYKICDILEYSDRGNDIAFLFFPLLLRYQQLLWGLPLNRFNPGRLLTHTVGLIKNGGLIISFCHSQREHQELLRLGQASGGIELIREGEMLSSLVDRKIINDRWFSVWQKCTP